MKSLHFSVIDSTNTYLLNHYEDLENITFVSADLQTAGKGRNQRKWQSENGVNLLFSLLIKERSLLEKFKAVSAAAGLSVAQAIESYGIRNVALKWPNDVYVSGKKITGILLQGISHEQLDCIVVGIGINVNQENYEGEYKRKPTSLALELGHKVDLDEFKASVYAHLISNLELLQQGTDLVPAVQKYDYLKGMNCWAELDGERKQIRVIGINSEYELDVETDGMIRSVASGEISFHSEEI